MYDASGNATGQTGVVDAKRAAYLGPPSVFIDAVASSLDENFGEQRGSCSYSVRHSAVECSWAQRVSACHLPCTPHPADGGVYAVTLNDTRAPLGDTMDNPIMVDQLPFATTLRIEMWPYTNNVSVACQSSSFNSPGASAFYAFR